MPKPLAWLATASARIGYARITMLLRLATASALLAPQPATPPTTRLRAAAPLVELYGERVSAGDETLIDTLSLKVDKGDRVALVGPNGSGKSTLARLLGQRVFSGGFGQAPESTAMQRPKL